MWLCYASFQWTFLTLWFFSLVTYYCLFYMYFRLWKRCEAKSKFERRSYWSSKWIIKQQRQFATSTTHLTQELLMNIQCSGGSRSFAKETRALEMRNVVDNDQLRAIIKADPPTTTWEIAEELNIHYSTVTGHLK